MEAPLASCASWYGQSRVSPGRFDRLPDEVVYLESGIDGAAIQIGLSRPDAPAGYESPVIAFASPYLWADLEDIPLATCLPFLVRNFVSHGYTVALIPVRGTGNSGGCPDLMGPSERSDLDQAITWLGTRPWSNGRVGMFGQSYDGSTPFEVASTGNPYLKTIVPVSGVSDLYELLYGRGTYDWRWWIFAPDFYYAEGGAGQHNPTTGRDASRTIEGTACPGFVESLAASAESFATAQRDPNGYWAARRVRPAIEKKYRGSIFFIQPLQDSQVRPDHNIPWIYRLERQSVYIKQLLNQSAHSLPDYKAGAGIGTRRDFAQLVLNWFDRWLKHDRNAEIGPRVEIQDSDGRWRATASWPPPNREVVYLGSDGRLRPRPGGPHSSQLLAPDQRSRYYFIINRPPLTTNDDWIPVPPAADRLCVTCALFRMKVTDTLRMSGIPSVHLQVTPTGPTGHVSAFLYAVDEKKGRMRRLGWGQADLRYPDGGNQVQPVVPGQRMRLTIDLVPLEAVFHKGEEVVVILSQGHADHMPSTGSFPVRLEYGKDLGRFEFAEVQAPRDGFFVPPKT
ncbi:MAG: CocE/NonD family hydrolase [Actinomycetota bacterium]